METSNFGEAIDVNAADSRYLSDAGRVKFFYGENWAKTKKVNVFIKDTWSEVEKDQFYHEKMWLVAKVVKLFDGNSWLVVKSGNVNVFYEEEEE